MDRLSKFLLIDRKGDRFSFHLLFHILLPMAFHAKSDGSRNPFTAVQIGLTVAPPAELLLCFHDLFVRHAPAERWGGEESSQQR